MNDLPHGPHDRRSAAGLLVFVGRLTLAAVAIWLTLSFVTMDAPVELRAMVGVVAIVSLFRPSEGLCIVALAIPLGDLIAIAMESSPIRLTEALVVAFLAGWLTNPTHGPARGPTPSAVVRCAALALSALVLASIAANVLQMKAVVPADWPGISSRTLHEYFKAGGDDFGAVAGGRLIEGLGLSAAVVMLLRRRPILAVWIPEALGAGCLMVVVAAYSLWHGYAFAAVLARHGLIGERIVAHVSDINAAASYFAMVLCLASGMAGRERGPRRILWLIMAGSAMEGLWLTGSRSANLAVAVTAVAATLWMLGRRWGIPVRHAVFAAVLAALVAAAAMRAAQIEADPTRQSIGFRIQFTESSIRMIRSHPWLGLGIGQYYRASPMYLNAELAWAYGSENAHDYFLQLAVEIGLVGLAACVVLTIGALWPPLRKMARMPDNYRLLGLIAGVTAFLLTCFTGHPFLVPEVAFTFWLATGLMVALGTHDEPGVDTDARADPAIDARTAHLLAPAVCVLALAVSVPLRARAAPPGPRRALPVEGLYDWETGVDGRSYRWTGEYASVFVEREARRVAIPVRAPRKEGDGEVAAEVSVDGSRAIRRPIGRDWTIVTVDLPLTAAIVQARRINIRSSRVQSLADGRIVGLQLGSPRVLEPE